MWERALREALVARPDPDPPPASMAVPVDGVTGDEPCSFPLPPSPTYLPMLFRFFVVGVDSDVTTTDSAVTEEAEAPEACVDEDAADTTAPGVISFNACPLDL